MVSFKQHTKHAAKIPRILKKNFTLIFRNWSSLILLILGPIILMFLIGLVFSSSNWDGISIGLVHENENVTAQFAGPISQVFGVSEFTNESACVNKIYRESITICIVFSDSFSLLAKKEFSVDNLPSGDVTFIYDNSKALVSRTVVGFMREQFGITADQVTIEGIAQLLGELETIETFLGSSSAEISSYLDSLEEVNDAITEFDKTLSVAVTEFDDVYTKLNNTKSELRNSNQSVQQQIRQLDNTLSESDEQLKDIEEILGTNKEAYDESKDSIESSLKTLKTFQTLYGATLDDDAKETLGLADIDEALDQLNSDDYAQLEEELDETLDTISDVRDQIALYESYSENVSEELPQRIAEFNKLVDQAGQMRDMLQSTQGFVVQLKTFTQTSLSSLGGLQTTLDATKDGFKNLENIDAESIVSPVRIEPKPLIASNSNVYLLFPIIIPIIVVFLSVLFSNIIMIDEIYSKAQLRNFILPVHDMYFVIGFFITNWIIVLFQIGMLFLFAKFLLGLAVLESFFSITVVSILLASVFILIGMIVAYVSTSKENSVLTSTFISVGALFLSDTFIPTELMSPVVAFIVKFNPLVLAEGAYRTILFHNLSFSFYGTKILILLSFTLVLFVILGLIVHRHRHWYHERE